MMNFLDLVLLTNSSLAFIFSLQIESKFDALSNPTKLSTVAYMEILSYNYWSSGPRFKVLKIITNSIFNNYYQMLSGLEIRSAEDLIIKKIKIIKK